MATYEIAAGGSTTSAGSPLDSTHSAVMIIDSPTTLEVPDQPDTAATVSSVPVSQERPTQPHTADVAPNALGDYDRPTQPHEAATIPATMGEGIVVPGTFEQVPVQVYNAQGEPMDRAIYVGNLGVFPTLAQVNDYGRATLALLKTTYSEFVVFAESGKQGVDYAWYSTKDSTSINPIEDDHGEIYVKEQPIEGNNGLNAALGVQLG